MEKVTVIFREFGHVWRCLNFVKLRSRVSDFQNFGGRPRITSIGITTPPKSPAPVR